MGSPGCVTAFIPSIAAFPPMAGIPANAVPAIPQMMAMLIKSFNEQQLASIGTANEKQIDVNAIGFITVGHTLHHKNILTERYL